MSNISGVNGISRTYVPAQSVEGLDGDTLIAYVQMNLSQLNTDIKKHTNLDQGSQQAKDLLNAAQMAFHKGNSTYSDVEKERILKDLAQAAQLLPPGADQNAILAKLNQFRRSACHDDDPNMPDITPNTLDNYVKTGIEADKSIPNSPKNAFDDGEAQSIIDGLKTVTESVGKNVELDMIELQQLISKRQMVIQLATQCMAKFNQGTESIIGNVK